MSLHAKEPELDHDATTRLAHDDAADRALADALPQIIWTCDAQGRLEWVNDRWLELTGLTERETLNDKGALDAVHPDDRPELARRWTRALETSAPTHIEYRIRNIAGEYRWHLARVAPVRGANGEVTRWVAAALDIHDRHVAEDALRASERRFETVFAVSPQPLAITRQSDGLFLSVNDAFLRLIGFEREELVGKTTVEIGLWTGEDRSSYLAELGAAPQWTREVSAPARDGRVVKFLLSSARAEFDGVPCLVSAATDVTQQRAIEEALRASEDGLLRADRRKDEFLALLSHELRNPLTPILASARLLEGRVDAEGRHDLDVIVRQVKHLVRLVDDLLDVSRVARGSVTLSRARLDLATVVAHAVEATEPLFDERKHRLEIRVPADGLTIDGDEVRLTQVVDNLLSNAARYTPPGGSISVTAERDGGDVVLHVRDSGVGIDPSLLPDLFEPLVQGARGADRALGGLGIGLSLVRSLTELHGGTVTARSDGLGRGSEFSVRLPAVDASERLAEPPSSHVPVREPSVSKTRVLLVDDHSDVADGLSRLLRVVGYDVRAALDPLEALALAESFQPEIAVLDIGLPVMDGYALARELRARLTDSPPILIALTGYGQTLDRLRSEASGFALHLVKPIDVDELVDALGRFTAGASLESGVVQSVS